MNSVFVSDTGAVLLLGYELEYGNTWQSSNRKENMLVSLKCKIIDKTMAAEPLTNMVYYGTVFHIKGQSQVQDI